MSQTHLSTPIGNCKQKNLSQLIEGLFWLNVEIIEPFYLASFQALGFRRKLSIGFMILHKHIAIFGQYSPLYCIKFIKLSWHHTVMSSYYSCWESFIIIVFGRSSVIICLRDSALGSAICKSIAANQLTISGSVILSCNITMSWLRTKDIRNWPSRAPRLCFWLLNCYCKECS